MADEFTLRNEPPRKTVERAEALLRLSSRWHVTLDAARWLYDSGISAHVDRLEERLATLESK